MCSGARVGSSRLAIASAGWPKPRELFEPYARRVAEETLDVMVASVDSHLAGYLLIEPQSSCPPFARTGTPEIADFNVLPSWQRVGIGTALLDEAERRVAEFCAVVGSVVGLYSDYGTAQRMYERRGCLPDGAGVVPAGELVRPGTQITPSDDPELMFTRQLP